MEKNMGENIVIVSHAATIKAMMLVLMKKRYDEIEGLIKNKNTGVSVFENGKFTIINCTKHLD